MEKIEILIVEEWIELYKGTACITEFYIKDDEDKDYMLCNLYKDISNIDINEIIAKCVSEYTYGFDYKIKKNEYREYCDTCHDYYTDIETQIIFRDTSKKNIIQYVDDHLGVNSKCISEEEIIDVWKDNQVFVKFIRI